MTHADLSHFFKKNPTLLTATERMIVMYGVARGLGWCHAHKIMHRDIKPENIMLDEYKRPRIGDFGMSKMSLSAEHTQRQGSPLYMAPEIMGSKDQWSFPADVFAFGITCAAIINNRTWVPKVNTVMGLKRLMESGGRPPLTGVTDNLKKVIEAMWHADPNERPGFDWIADCLEQPDCWLDGVDEQQFKAYAAWVREEETRTPKPPRGLAACLQRAILAPKLIDRIGEPRSLKEILTRLAACMATEDPALVERLKEHLTEQLDMEKCFVHVDAVGGSSGELLPDDEDDGEDEEWPEGDPYHLRIVRSGVVACLDIILGQEATVGELYEKLRVITGGDVTITIGGEPLTTDLSTLVATLKPKEFIFEATPA
jgi:serine/threonine protein kinase